VREDMALQLGASVLQMTYAVVCIFSKKRSPLRVPSVYGKASRLSVLVCVLFLWVYLY
jgi:hypothetical protein